MAGQEVQLRPITDDDVAPVAQFLHTHLNPRVTAASWENGIRTRWADLGPNHGFLLEHPSGIVGANLAFYSRQVLAEKSVQVCNLGALCVLPEHRTHVVRLVRAILAQRDYVFTDFSPSGNVVALNERLRFQHLDTTTLVCANLPARPPRGCEVIWAPDAISEALSGPALTVHLDHLASPAAHQVVLRERGETCLVVLRRDRRKGLALFSTVLHVSNHELFGARHPALLSTLLPRMRTPFTLIERRISPVVPLGAVTLPRPRPRMIRDRDGGGDDVGYLYSELTQIPW